MLSHKPRTALLFKKEFPEFPVMSGDIFVFAGK